MWRPTRPLRSGRRKDQRPSFEHLFLRVHYYAQGRAHEKKKAVLHLPLLPNAQAGEERIPAP